MDAVTGGQSQESRGQIDPQEAYPYNGRAKRLQVVGFKNSGKTTLTETLLRFAIGHGLSASAIKHHGHGGVPEAPPGDTDASRLFQAGAASSIVAGGGQIVLQGRRPADEAGELTSLIQLTEAYAHPDLILIEGFKAEPYPKLVLLRSLEDWTELKRLTNIVLILTVDEELARHPSLSIEAIPAGGSNPRVLPRARSEEIAAWFTHWMKGEQAADETL